VSNVKENRQHMSTNLFINYGRITQGPKGRGDFSPKICQHHFR